MRESAELQRLRAALATAGRQVKRHPHDADAAHAAEAARTEYQIEKAIDEMSTRLHGVELSAEQRRRIADAVGVTGSADYAPIAGQDRSTLAAIIARAEARVARRVNAPSAGDVDPAA